MNPTTFFLLQLIGPIMVMMGIAVMVKAPMFRQLYKDLDQNATVLVVIALLALTMGMAIVLKHNLWGNVREIIVSLMGWIALVKGLSLLFMPDVGMNLATNLTRGNRIYGAGIFFLLLGGWITWLGFWM